MTHHDVAQNRHGRFVRVDGLSIFVEEHGAGPPLLLLHGGTSSGAAWQPHIAGFAARYRVIIPDSRGHGRTANPIETMSYQLLADDTAALIQTLGLHRPLIFGFSDGGQVALEIGMRYPAIPRALVLCGTWFRFADSYRAMMRALLGDEQSPEVDTERFAHEHPAWAAELREIYGDDGWRRLLRQVKPMWTTPLNYTPADFARITAPTLVLVGDRDGIAPVEEAAELYRLLPDAELAVIPGADHVGSIDANVALTQALVLDFLGRRAAAPAIS